MLYSLYEWNQMALAPWRISAAHGAQILRSPLNPFHEFLPAKISAASMEMFEALTRNYPRPEWNLPNFEIGAQKVPVEIETICNKPFGKLLHFARDPKALAKARGRNGGPDPRVLIVAPMSGHYVTLLKKTVLALLPDHEVYITDWADAREVPLSEGRF